MFVQVDRWLYTYRGWKIAEKSSSRLAHGAQYNVRAVLQAWLEGGFGFSGSLYNFKTPNGCRTRKYKKSILILIWNFHSAFSNGPENYLTAPENSDMEFKKIICFPIPNWIRVDPKMFHIRTRIFKNSTSMYLKNRFLVVGWTRKLSYGTRKLRHGIQKSYVFQFQTGFGWTRKCFIPEPDFTTIIILRSGRRAAGWWGTLEITRARRSSFGAT